MLYMYAERIKSLVSQLEVEIQGSKVALRVSAGCAFSQSDDTAVSVVERAKETIGRETLSEESLKG